MLHYAQVPPDEHWVETLVVSRRLSLAGDVLPDAERFQDALSGLSTNGNLGGCDRAKMRVLPFLRSVSGDRGRQDAQWIHVLQLIFYLWTSQF